jgi:hypothetical protein
MVVDASLTLEGLWLARTFFATPLPLENYVGLIGKPTRTLSGPPAPYGHRNNQIHVYDAFGFYLNEDHATGKIGEVTFVLDETRGTFPVSKPFQGKLEVGGVLFYPSMEEREYPTEASIRFERVLPGRYKAESGDVAIYLTANKKKDPSKRRPVKQRSFVEVSIDFGVHAHVRDPQARHSPSPGRQGHSHHR